MQTLKVARIARFMIERAIVKGTSLGKGFCWGNFNSGPSLQRGANNNRLAAATIGIRSKMETIKWLLTFALNFQDSDEIKSRSE